MYESDDKSSPVQASSYVGGYSPWAPSGLLGGTGKAGIASLLLGGLALALAIASQLTGLAWVAAIFAVVFGLLAVLPRASWTQKVTSGVGVVASLAAFAILVS